MSDTGSSEQIQTLIEERDRWQAAFDRIALDPAEYRHALGHVAHCEDNCDQCRSLARQALDGGVDAQERAADILSQRDLLQGAVVEAVGQVAFALGAEARVDLVQGIRQLRTERDQAEAEQEALAAYVRNIKAERNRMRDAARDLVVAARAWRNVMLIRPMPEQREQAVQAFSDAIDAFDPMLSEATQGDLSDGG